MQKIRTAPGRRRMSMRRKSASAAVSRGLNGQTAAHLRRLATLSVRKRTGLTALFSGPSGTGKTIATALARSLGGPLYRVSLSDLAQRYIGETEKNLSHLFADARRRNAVLFFDEADALFGKRTGVKDSHDRYANLEVSHLLAQMARHRGIVILSTNTPGRIDPAISRRFDAILSLPDRDPAPETT